MLLEHAQSASASIDIILYAPMEKKFCVLRRRYFACDDDGIGRSGSGRGNIAGKTERPLGVWS